MLWSVWLSELLPWTTDLKYGRRQVNAHSIECIGGIPVSLWLLRLSSHRFFWSWDLLHGTVICMGQGVLKCVNNVLHLTDF